MLGVLQQSTEWLSSNETWLSSIALVFFAGMQWWISRSQLKRELRFRRFELANKMDNACIIYQFDTKSTHNIIDWFNRNQSQFMYLLNDKDLIHYDTFLTFLKSIHGENKPFKTVIKTYREYLTALDAALMNADYGLQKRKRRSQK